MMRYIESEANALCTTSGSVGYTNRLTASATSALWMSIFGGMQPRLRQVPLNGPG